MALFRRTFAPKQPARAAIVFHHGFGEHGGFYERFGEEMAVRGFAFSAHDARGHGASPGQRGHVDSWDEFRDDLALHIERVAAEHPGLPLFLIGHSLGGLVVLDHAYRRSSGLSGVIALGPAVGAVGVPPWVMALGRMLSNLWPRFALDSRLERGNLSRDPEARRLFKEDPLYHTQGSARLTVEFEKTRAELIEHAAEIALPVLVLHGGADRIVFPEASRSFFDRLRVGDRQRKEYPSAFHNLLLETNREEVVADLTSWIDARIART